MNILSIKANDASSNIIVKKENTNGNDGFKNRSSGIKQTLITDALVKKSKRLNDTTQQNPKVQIKLTNSDKDTKSNSASYEHSKNYVDNGNIVN